MNSTTTTAPLFNPVLEVWGMRLTAYLGAMGMVVLHYDTFLTLKDEVRLVWPGGLSLPKVLYYLNRYLAFFAIIFCNYQVSGVRPAIPDSVCKGWMMVSGLALPISTSASTALLTLRVTALYRRVRWFSPVLWTAFGLFQGLRVSMMIYGAATLFESLKYSPISNVCIPTDTKYRSAAPMMVPGLYDFLLLTLTLIKGIGSAISLKAGSGSAIMFTLIRDEILFFSIISSLRIFNSIAWMVLSPSLIGVGIYAEWGLESTLTSRFFINLRSIALHEPVTTFNTQAMPSAISAARTRRTWQQQGLISSDFSVGLDTNKSFHATMIKSRGGDIHQSEMFDLEDMKMQTPHAGDHGGMP